MVKNTMESLKGNATGGKEDYLAYMKKLAMQKEQSATDSAKSVRDQQVGRAEASYAENQRLAEEAYAKAAADYESRMQGAKRDTNVQMARIEKFLPQMMSSQGLTGGVAQSTILDAYSRAASMRSDADRSYADAILALDRDKVAADADRLQVRDNAVSVAQDTYADALERAATQRASEEQAAYDADYQRAYEAAAQKEYEERQWAREEAVNHLGAVEAAIDTKAAAGTGEDGKLSPEAWEGLKAYADEQRKNMPQAQQRELDAYLAQIEAYVRETESEESPQTDKRATYDASTSKGSTTVFNVKFGDGETAKVQNAGYTNDENVLKAAESIENGQLFSMNDKVFMKHKDRVYEIEAKTFFGDDFKKLKSYLSGK